MLYVNLSVKCLKFAPKWSFSYFQPISAAIFVTIATVKIESFPEFFTWAIVLIILLEETCDKQFSFFGLIRGQNSLLMHVPFWFNMVISPNYAFLLVKSNCQCLAFEGAKLNPLMHVALSEGCRTLLGRVLRLHKLTVHLRNEFDFWNVHGITNTSCLLQG